jgi:hypothetical protein
MRLITRGNSQLIQSAYLTHNSVYAKLIINTRNKWPAWSDCTAASQHLDEFPSQRCAVFIESDKQDAILMVIPDSDADALLLSNTTRYSYCEKDQLVFVWLSNALELQHTTEVCALGDAS